MDEKQGSNNEGIPGVPVKNEEPGDKGLAVLGYILPILFFLLLVTESKNKGFAKYHANQQLNLLIAYICAMALTAISLGLLVFTYIVPVVLAVIGLIRALNGEMKPLPIFGRLDLIK